MPIFQDIHGLSVKFFIQKDIQQEIQAELYEIITSLGGRVEAKVPRQGYVLLQNGTAEEERLRSCWTSSDRPERYFVPYTFVEACKIAGILLTQIFMQDGEPIKMHIHPSIANINARMALSQRIMHSGGDPNASIQSARAILADPNTEVFQHLVKTYQGMPDKYVESYMWVNKCIERGALMYTPLVYKNPGGRRPGEERTQFTEEDEARLCAWIAAKIPFKETGGRTGNRLYQQLCEMGADPDYAWVTRHTWQSWRERYKKNSARLNTVIAEIVDQRKPTQGEKGQYGYVRKAEERSKRTRRRRDPNLNIPHESEDELLTVETGLEDDNAFKRARLGDYEQSQMKADAKPQLPTTKENVLFPVCLQLADAALRDIAKEYRFTLEEVEEYYAKYGEIERTRTRFAMMREELSIKFRDDDPI